MKITRKLILILTLLILCNNILLFSQSVLDSKVEQQIDKNSKYYIIEQDGKKWNIDTTMITVKLKPEIKTLPENFIALRTNKLGFIDLKIPNNISFLDYVSTLKSNAKLFEVIEYSIFGEYSVISNDPSYTNQWYLNSVNIFNAWDYTMGSSNVTVAVLDAGLDINHEDIGNGTDGYNNIATGAWNFENNTSNVSSTNFHGTFVAGIISAKTNNRKGISGIGGGNNRYGIKILPLNIGTNSPISGVLDDAILDAVSKNAKIIQMSLTVPQSTAIESAILYAVNNNVLVICAAGNNYSSSVGYPASNSNVIAVGAINQNNQRVNFSNYGTNLNIVAPGENIYSTNLNSTYSYSAGTSFAAPIVSGIAALILSVNPELTQKEVANIIEQTAQKVGNYNYTNSANRPNGTWHQEMGYGLVDAYEAVKMARCETITLKGTQSTKKVICNEIIVEDAVVPSGVKLELQATESVIINPGTVIESGSSFIIW